MNTYTLSLIMDLHHLDIVSLLAALQGLIQVKNNLPVSLKFFVLFKYSFRRLTTQSCGTL